MNFIYLCCFQVVKTLYENSKKTALLLLFIFIAAFLYVNDSIRQAHSNKQIEKLKSDLVAHEDYKKCGGMNFSGKYILGNYGVEFFHPSCRTYNFHCKNAEYCGMSPNVQTYDCRVGVDCEMILLITDQYNNIVLKGVNNKESLELNQGFFRDVVKLQKMPDGFPYLVLKDTSFGSWGQGHNYHLHSIQDKFKKIIEIGPSYKGFYKDNKGNYIIDIQQNYRPEFGSNADNLTDEISYRLLSVDEYQSTGKLFVIDMSAIKNTVINFTDKKIDRLMVYAKKSNNKIIKAFDSEEKWSYFWAPDSASEKWPLKLLRIRESNPNKGYVYGDLFDLVRNGRIDLAKKYFDILIPDQYDKYKAILPESLNSKRKLWKGYLNDLKEQSEYRRGSDNPFFFPSEATKDLYWPIFKLINITYW